MKTVVIGMLSPSLDAAKKRGDRWLGWRPSVDLCRQKGLRIDRFDLLYSGANEKLFHVVAADIRAASPRTQVCGHHVEIEEPWNFEELHFKLREFAQCYSFDVERERYLVHATSESSVAQSCLVMLTQARTFPASLVHSIPSEHRRGVGTHTIVEVADPRDASPTPAEDSNDRVVRAQFSTNSRALQRRIDEISRAMTTSRAPLLLQGGPGVGKSRLAAHLFEQARQRGTVQGRFVEVNCASLRGERAMGVLFGAHLGNVPTGGLVRQADRGVLFLDEVSELGAEEQAMLVRAIERGRYLPEGAEREVEVTFRLISATARDLREAVAKGSFREDLWSRIGAWTFELPSLLERLEDLEMSLDDELSRLAETHGERVTMNREARRAFFEFARSPSSSWLGNFRDLSMACERMVSLADGGQITLDVVRSEIERLRQSWKRPHPDGQEEILGRYLAEKDIASLDLFERVQLQEVLRVCSTARSLSDAGRTLFSESRKARTSKNDADRVRKYLAKYDLGWSDFV